MQMVHSGWGDRSLNLLLQWMLNHYHLQPSDRQVNGYCSTGYVSGVLWSCGLHAHWKANIVHISQCLWESWATVDRQRRHTDVVPFALFLFFFNGEEKYLFSNLDSSLSIVWINMLFVIMSLFLSFCSLSIPSKCWHTYNALNVPHVAEKKDQKN